MAIKNSWASGEVLTAADLTDTMKGVYINAQTGTTYTFATADSFVSLSNASGGTATIPANATAAFNTGAVVGVMNAGTAGSFTIGTAAGVTLNAVSGTTTLAPLESATLVKLGTNTWQLSKGGGAAESTQGLYLITTQSFSAAASVSVNNCFTSAYANYFVTCHLSGSSYVGGSAIAIRLRASGADNSSAQYYYGTLRVSSANGATTTTNGNAATSFVVTTVGNNIPRFTSFALSLFGPQLASETSLTGQAYFYDTATAAPAMVGCVHNVASAFDGLSILPTSSNISGTVSVFAYR